MAVIGRVRIAYSPPPSGPHTTYILNTHTQNTSSYSIYILWVISLVLIYITLNWLFCIKIHPLHYILRLFYFHDTHFLCSVFIKSAFHIALFLLLLLFPSVKFFSLIFKCYSSYSICVISSLCMYSCYVWSHMFTLSAKFKNLEFYEANFSQLLYGD